jgi:pimeloyl-ACP methyl ester carboxylesterase
MGLEDRIQSKALVLTLDRPGVGKSPRSPAPSLELQAAHLATVLEKLGNGPAVVVGHSLGGPVSIQLAADRPELVHRLLLLDPTPITNTAPLKAAIAIFGPVALAQRLGPLGLPLMTVMRALITQQSRTESKKHGFEVGPEFKKSIDTVFDNDQSAQMLKLLKPFHGDAAALTARLRAHPISAGGVLVTADRKEGHAVKVDHAEMARLAGLDYEAWPRCGHSVHLHLPERTAEATLALLP